MNEAGRQSIREGFGHMLESVRLRESRKEKRNPRAVIDPLLLGDEKFMDMFLEFMEKTSVGGSSSNFETIPFSVLFPLSCSGSFPRLLARLFVLTQRKGCANRAFLRSARLVSGANRKIKIRI